MDVHHNAAISLYTRGLAGHLPELDRGDEDRAELGDAHRPRLPGDNELDRQPGIDHDGEVRGTRPGLEGRARAGELRGLVSLCRL